MQNNFDCKNISNILAELFYITANALSSQNIYSQSNFYLNLVKFLNPKFLFIQYITAENFMMTEDYKKAKKIYSLFKKKYGEFYNWHSSKQIAMIKVEKSKNNEAIQLMEKSLKKLKNLSFYQIMILLNF